MWLVGCACGFEVRAPAADLPELLSSHLATVHPELEYPDEQLTEWLATAVLVPTAGWWGAMAPIEHTRSAVRKEVKGMAKWKLSPGDWCHIDVLSGDHERARRFYGDVFGWEFEDYPGVGDYTGARTSEDGIESGIGGLAQTVGLRPPASNGIVPYLLAPDMDATLAAIQRAGGEVVIPRTDAHGFGDFAHFRDPDGNLIGLWRDAPSQAHG